MSRSFKLEYRVLCAEADGKPAPANLLEVCGPHLKWRRTTRDQEPQVFAAPRYAGAIDDSELRLPTPLGKDEVSEVILKGIAAAKVAFVITSDLEAEDLTPLQAALGVSQAASGAFEGVVIDADAGIGYPAELMAAIGSALNDEGLHHVRDGVVIEVETAGPTARLATYGMGKYGQRDFVIDSLPVEHIELGRRVLYDTVCQHAAMRAPVEPGQVMAYDKSPEGRWFFEALPDGRLRISDCAVDKKAPVPGLSRFLKIAVAGAP